MASAFAAQDPAYAATVWKDCFGKEVNFTVVVAEMFRV